MSPRPVVGGPCRAPEAIPDGVPLGAIGRHDDDDAVEVQPVEFMQLAIEAREGRRPVAVFPVAAVASTLVGAPAYMEIDALGEFLDEGWRASSAAFGYTAWSPTRCPSSRRRAVARAPSGDARL